MSWRKAFLMAAFAFQSFSLFEQILGNDCLLKGREGDSMCDLLADSGLWNL